MFKLITLVKYRILALCGIIFLISNVFALPEAEEVPIPEEAIITQSGLGGGVENGEPRSGAGIEEEEIPPWQNAEFVMQSIARAYPNKVMELAWRRDDWAIRIYDQWFYWAGGKMLPENALVEAQNYSRYPFYPYSRELRPLPDISDEEVAILQERALERTRNRLPRNQGFLNTLWRIEDQSSADRQSKTTFFFGIRVNIHRDLLEDLARIEENLMNRQQNDAELAEYIRSLSSIAGFTWRNIAGSVNRSNHSYGIAVDFLPESYGREQVYWLWARDIGLNWYNYPYENRHMPPDSFVEEFEKAGFIWGGKWLYFDTIHFEYRPEILAINGLLGDDYE